MIFPVGTKLNYERTLPTPVGSDSCTTSQTSAGRSERCKSPANVTRCTINLAGTIAPGPLPKSRTASFLATPHATSCGARSLQAVHSLNPFTEVPPRKAPRTESLIYRHRVFLPR